MKKLMSVILAVICCMGLLAPVSAYADAAAGGEHNYQQADYYVMVDAWDGYVNFRYGPGLEYGINTPIYNGEILHVTQTADNYYDGLHWAQVEYNGGYGWISLSEVTVVDNYSDNGYDVPISENFYSPFTGTVIETEPAEKTVYLDDAMLENGEWQDGLYDVIAKLEKMIDAAYAPYTEYFTGAVLVDKEGKVFTGTFVENSDPKLSICAERAAVAKAVSEGSRDYKFIAVIGKEKGSNGTDYYTPCEDCLQVLKEFVNSGDFYVFTVQLNEDGSAGKYEIRTLGKLIAEK